MKDVKHPPYFLGKIRKHLNALSEKSFQTTLAWVPSHCSIPGNEKEDSLAKVGTANGEIYEIPIAFNEFFAIVRQNTIISWQNSWTKGDLGRWLLPIIPKVSTNPWFKGLDVGRDFICMMSRLMSNHYGFDAHLHRIGLGEGGICACGEGYHDIEHVVWSCPEHRGARSKLIASLQAEGRQPAVPVRDVLASLDLPYMSSIYIFLKSIHAPV